MPILGIIASQMTGHLVVAVQGAYFAGGYDGSNLSGIDKVDFSNDSKSTLSATLTSGRNGGAGFANSGTAAYFAGGTISYPTFTDGIDKLAFSADTKSTLSATLSTATQAPGGFANSGTAGYVAGGYDGAFLSRIDKIAFSADTKTTLAATLNVNRAYIQGCANSGTAGYWAGGASNNGSTLRDIIDKVAFSSDTRTTLSAVLASTKYNLGGCAKSGTAAYWAGGNSPAIDLIQKLTFSGETRTTLSATLTSARQSVYAAANSGTL